MAQKINKIEIKGIKYPAWGGFYAQEKFEQLTGESAERVTATITNSVTFLWCTLWAGSKMEEEKLKLSLDEFKAMVNEDAGILVDIRKQQLAQAKEEPKK